MMQIELTTQPLCPPMAVIFNPEIPEQKTWTEGSTDADEHSTHMHSMTCLK